MNYKFYPIRFSRKSWNIPIISEHKCNELCNKEVIMNIIDDNIVILVVENIENNSVCKKINTINTTNIHISSYDKKINSESLYNIDTVIIPDGKINLEISYPLIRPKNINLKSKNGFTLRKLLDLVKKEYIKVYQEEEETASKILYHLQKPCDNCIDLTEVVNIEEKDYEENENCSICLTTMNNEKVINLNCSHIFHTNCINKWIKANNNSCPMCRSSVWTCKDCNNTKIINFDYEGSVIPIDYRGNFLNRNPTDGVYGIYGYDLEDLYIYKLYYNREKKRLHLTITS